MGSVMKRVGSFHPIWEEGFFTCLFLSAVACAFFIVETSWGAAETQRGNTKGSVLLAKIQQRRRGGG